MNEKNNFLHTFNGIPYDEEVVPFPNFGAVTFQHNRELAEKICLKNSSISWSFSDINNLILKLQSYFDEIGIGKNDVVGLSFGSNPVEILLFFALMFRGAIIQPIFPTYSEIDISKLFKKSEAKIIFNFQSDNSYSQLKSKIIDIANQQKFLTKIGNIKQKEATLPYLQLKHPALRMLINKIGIVEFNQYNLLTSAQSIGKLFHLFRPGISILNHNIEDLTDFIYSIFAPFYYGKTVEIDEKITDEKIVKMLNNGSIHYSYLSDDFDCELGKIKLNSNKILRDATIIINIKNQKNNFKVPKELPITKIFGDDYSCGVGVIIDENNNWKCMDNIEILEFDNPVNSVLQIQNETIAFRGHTIFDRIIE
ncbi:MAG: AMP-binding protein [Candidatus Marinimicrobia bacterium]|nr:AMP-binding protein [Candidatus Neomarinimicrobiota bacterium]